MSPFYRRQHAWAAQLFLRPLGEGKGGGVPRCAFDVGTATLDGSDGVMCAREQACSDEHSPRSPACCYRQEARRRYAWKASSAVPVASKKKFKKKDEEDGGKKKEVISLTRRKARRRPRDDVFFLRKRAM